MTTNLGAAHRLVEAAEAANKQLSRITPQVRELADALSELEQRSAQGGDDIKSFVLCPSHCRQRPDSHE